MKTCSIKIFICIFETIHPHFSFFFCRVINNFIKGKKVDVALRDLEFTRKRIAKDVSKTVKSAVSNAENNYQFDIDNLFVKEAYVGKSLVMKRFRPRAKGRASGIKKPFSNITIVLQEKQEKKNGPKN